MVKIENELLLFKEDLKESQKKLEKFEKLDTTQKDESQLKAQARGIESCKSSISELEELIEEVIEEMTEEQIKSYNKGIRSIKSSEELDFFLIPEFVCVKSSIDGMYRVMEKADAPYGTCFSVGETVEDAIHDGARFLGIAPSEIEME